VLELARADVVPGGTKRNHAWLGATTDWGSLTTPEQHVLADAQTSGGLLLASTDLDRLLDALHEEGVAGATIGEVVEGTPGRIVLRGRVEG
jgi:selenide,water dikinase